MTRDTRYTNSIRVAMESYGHATNAQLLEKLRETYPEVSATTVHRATTRLHERGELENAPADKHGAMRYDISLIAHDHFICNFCDGIRDIDVAESILPKISKALGGCKVTGRLVIYGACEKCLLQGANT